MRDVKETIASVTAKKDRETDKAVEQEISECRRGLDRSFLEARANFEARAAEDVEWVVEEAIGALR